MLRRRDRPWPTRCTRERRLGMRGRVPRPPSVARSFAAMLPWVHVGMNLIYLVPGETGGRETYARELAPRLVEQGVRLTCFVNREASAERASLWRQLGRVVSVPISGRSRAQWAAGEQLILPGLAERSGIDLLHSPANF